MIENIAYELVPRLTLPGQRTKQNVLIDTSVASPNSPRNGPELPMSGVIQARSGPLTFHHHVPTYVVELLPTIGEG